MNPINLQKYVLYCMGEGYFDRKRYSADLAHERALDRVEVSRLDGMQRALFRAESVPVMSSRFQNVEQLPPVLRPLVQLVQSGVQLLSQLAGQLAQAAKPVVQLPLTMVKGAFEATVGKLLSFFFGRRLERTEEEREQREKGDFAQTDLFTRFVTHESSGGAQGDQR